MDNVSKIAEKLSRFANSNTALNMGLAAVFAALTLRSVEQQRDIEDLEAEKSSLLASNKQIKKTIWSWKQNLIADAEIDSSLVPVARIGSIYGDPSLNGYSTKKDVNSPPSNFVV